jgi:endonuclease/exonuclease/phosphatase family metal-dependent hydrolase
MRVVTHNIRSLRDDRRAVVRVLRDINPDVVCIQEAPRFLFWRRSCRRLADAAGLRIVGGGRSAAANLLLARPSIEVRAARDVLFSKDRGLHQRGVAMLQLRWNGRAVAVAGTHLDGVEEPRLRHIAELHDAIKEFVPAGVPVALAGDFNTEPGSRSWAALCAGGQDAFAVAGRGDGMTATAKQATRRIDAVFVSDGMSVLTCTALDSADVRRASDHRPVVVDIELTAETASNSLG